MTTYSVIIGSPPGGSTLLSGAFGSFGCPIKDSTPAERLNMAFKSGNAGSEIRMHEGKVVDIRQISRLRPKANFQIGKLCRERVAPCPGVADMFVEINDEQRHDHPRLYRSITVVAGIRQRSYPVAGQPSGVSWVLRPPPDHTVIVNAMRFVGVDVEEQAPPRLSNADFETPGADRSRNRIDVSGPADGSQLAAVRAAAEQSVTAVRIQAPRQRFRPACQGARAPRPSRDRYAGHHSSHPATCHAKAQRPAR